MPDQEIILIVEDRKDLRLILSKYLKFEGYKVLTSENGDIALKLLKSLAAKDLPSCIILDLMMPVMDGNGLLTAMRSDPTLFKIPVIIFSAAGKVQDSPQIAQKMSKPAPLEKIKEAIQSCCAVTADNDA